MSAICLAAVVSGIVACKKSEESSPSQTSTMQPGSSTGQDVFVAYRDSDNNVYANKNFAANTDISIFSWTFSSNGDGDGRVYIKFSELSDIPASAQITSAKLSLYGLSSGGAISGGNTDDNALWVKQVTGANWDKSTITWTNKPATTSTGQVAIAASTSQWSYNVTDLDVTAMVADMVKSGKNYGFCLQLQTETFYRAMGFHSSRSSDASKRPKLVVQYTVPN